MKCEFFQQALFPNLCVLETLFPLVLLGGSLPDFGQFPPTYGLNSSELSAGPLHTSRTLFVALSSTLFCPGYSSFLDFPRISAQSPQLEDFTRLSLDNVSLTHGQETLKA